MIPEEFARNNPSLMVSLVGLFAGLATFLIWRILCRMEKKIDEWSKGCTDCKKELVKSKDFEDWKEGREELWKRANHHLHDDKGNVVIPTTLINS